MYRTLFVLPPTPATTALFPWRLEIWHCFTLDSLMLSIALCPVILRRSWVWSRATLVQWEPVLMYKYFLQFLLRKMLCFLSFSTIHKDTNSRMSPCIFFPSLFHFSISLPGITSQIYYLHPSLSFRLCFQNN